MIKLVWSAMLASSPSPAPHAGVTEARKLLFPLRNYIGPRADTQLANIFENAEINIAAAIASRPASTISLCDPAITIAGIRQFGLASDGSDLRDLEAAFARLGRPASAVGEDYMRHVYEAMNILGDPHDACDFGDSEAAALRQTIDDAYARLSIISAREKPEGGVGD